MTKDIASGAGDEAIVPVTYHIQWGREGKISIFIKNAFRFKGLC